MTQHFDSPLFLVIILLLFFDKNVGLFILLINAVPLHRGRASWETSLMLSRSWLFLYQNNKKINFFSLNHPLLCLATPPKSCHTGFTHSHQMWIARFSTSIDLFYLLRGWYPAGSYAEHGLSLYLARCYSFKGMNKACWFRYRYRTDTWAELE